MKQFLLLIIFSCSQVFYSQKTLQVDYSFYTNLGMPSTDVWTLLSNNKYNLYLLKSSTPAVFPKSENRESIEVKIKIDKEFTQHLFQNFENDSIYSQGLVIDKAYYVHDKIAKQNWIITEESKNINDYKCYKATTTFRGRDYEAWFTPEIACKGGPWKFNNLPGLILELYDSKKIIVFKALSIETNHKDIKGTYENIQKLGNKIAFPDYVKLSDSSIADAMKLALSQLNLSEDAIIETVEVKTRNNIEIKYEWEE